MKGMRRATPCPGPIARAKRGGSGRGPHWTFTPLTQTSVQVIARLSLAIPGIGFHSDGESRLQNRR